MLLHLVLKLALPLSTSPPSSYAVAVSTEPSNVSGSSGLKVIKFARAISQADNLINFGLASISQRQALLPITNSLMGSEGQLDGC